MAKRKVSGLGALDRQIQSTRKAISAKKKKAAAVKSAKKKAATLSRLKNQLKRMGGSTAKKRR